MYINLNVTYYMLSQLSNNSLFTKSKNFDFTHKNNDTREIWNILEI